MEEKNAENVKSAEVAKIGENETLSTDYTTKRESNGAENNASYIEMAKNIAVYQIKEQTISKDEPDVYDVEIVSSDDNGRYIVTATTKSVFETYWAVFVEIFDDNSHYNVKANYHGDGISVNDWISKYKTESEYSWGKPQAKYQ